MGGWCQLRLMVWLVANRMGEWMGKSVRGWPGWLIRLLRIRGGWVTGSMGGQVGVCLLV